MLDAFTWYKQSALRWQGAITVYIDPWEVPPGHPPADVVFITHAHFDHFSQPDLDRVAGVNSIVVAPNDVAAQITRGDVRAAAPGDTLDVEGIAVETVAAYNLKPERLEHHPRDNNWVGYVLTFGDTRYYLAGDTDHTPELSAVKADVAFLPVGGTYTMDVEEAAGAVKDLQPRIAVPYHFGFVVGSRAAGQQFVDAIAPTEGRVLTPVHPYEQD